MKSVIKAFGIMFFCAVGSLVSGGASWAFSRSLLDSSEQMDPAWLVAEAPAAAPVDSAQFPLNHKSNLSPGVAVSLALLPGVALHGTGYFYANRPWTAGALLLAEAGGLAMAYRGGRDVYAAANSVDFDKFSNYRGDTGQLSNGLGLALGGMMIFLSSWLFDLTGSPIAAAQDNAAHPPGAHTSSSPVITPRLTARGLEVSLERLF